MIKKRECDICSRVINHPMCVKCFLKHFKLWLEDQNMNPVKKKQILSDIKKQFNKETLNEDLCVLCGKECASICPYCLSLKIATLLKKYKINEEFIEGYNQLFNYEPYDDHIIELEVYSKMKINTITNKGQLPNIQEILEELSFNSS